MDNAASTRLCDEAFEAMLPFLKEDHFNPGSIYEAADNARRALTGARKKIAGTIGADPGSIYFTSGGTESDNWALKGTAELVLSGGYTRNGRVIKKPHIITSLFEHHAVTETCRWLERHGCSVSFARPDSTGHVSADSIERLINEDTVLISLMTVNNELGTLNPVAEAGRVAHEHGILFHTDAVASYAHIPMDVKAMNIDMLSAGAHKFNGPKGAGFLYADKRTGLKPFMHGGGQETGRRAGTVNVAAITGMAAAALRHHEHMEADLARRLELDGYLMGKLDKAGFFTAGKVTREPAIINGTGERLPGFISLTLPGINAEELIVRLGMQGICISGRSACSSSLDSMSHVLSSIGLDRAAADSTVRISMNEDNTEEEADILIEAIRKCIC